MHSIHAGISSVSRLGQQPCGSSIIVEAVQLMLPHFRDRVSCCHSQRGKARYQAENQALSVNNSSRASLAVRWCEYTLTILQELTECLWKYKPVRSGSAQSRRHERRFLCETCCILRAEA